MVEPSRVTTVDSEILRHCAFSFPAVAFTLGRANWSCLRQLYNVLARDMQVTVCYSACLFCFIGIFSRCPQADFCCTQWWVRVKGPVEKENVRVCVTKSDAVVWVTGALVL